MKYIRLAALAALLTLALSAHAQTNRGYTGTWYNPAQSGHGYNLEVLENGDILAYWYVYRDDGTSTFLFGILSGGPQSFSGTLNMTEGMVFGDFDPGTNNTMPWGELTLVFDDCQNADAFWSTTLDGFSNGSTPLFRLTSAAGQECTDSPFVGNFVLEVIGTDGIESGRAVILPTGNFVYFSVNNNTNEVGYGTWEDTGSNTMSFEADGFEEADEPSPLVGNATSNDDGFLASADGGLVALGATRTASYQNNLSLADLAGSFSLRNTFTGGGFGSATITDDGMISGNLVDCPFDGQITIPDGGRNQFELALDYTCVGPSSFVGAGTANGDDLSIIIVDLQEEGGFLLALERN